MGITEKDRLKALNDEQLALFKLSEKSSLTIYPPSIVPSVFNLPGTTFSRKPVRYTRTTAPLDGIHIDLINKDSRAESFLWHTQPQNVVHGVRYGIVKPEALTGQGISALGQYRQAVLERMYTYDIVSNKFAEKEALLSLTQERIELLQPLERLINRYDQSMTVEENKRHIIDILNTSREQWIQYRYSLKQNKMLQLLNHYDCQAVDKIQAYIDADIDAIETYLAWLNQQTWNQNFCRKTVLAPIGCRSLMTFIKKRMIGMLRQAQELNQNMTYSRRAGAFMRGDFNSACEEAMSVINHFQADLHDAILREHQGHFQNNSPDDVVSVEFSLPWESRSTIRRILMAISHIEEADKIVRENNRYQLNSTVSQKSIPLQQTRFTKWGGINIGWTTIQRLGIWFWNFLVAGLICGVVLDLPVGLLCGLFGYEIISLAEQVRISVENPLFEQTTFYQLTQHMIMPNPSLGAKFGYKLYNFVRNTCWEAFKGIATAMGEVTIDLWDNVCDDYWVGHHALRNEKEIILCVREEFDALTKSVQALDQRLDEKCRRHQRRVQQDVDVELKKIDEKKVKDSDVQSEQQEDNPCFQYLFEGKQIHPDEVKRRFAHAPYSLTVGEWNDILNASMRGGRTFVEAFTHPIHTKHPFTGLIFNVLYAVGGFAILTPQYLSFLGQSYLQFCHVLGHAMARGKVSSAIGSGILQAQVGAATFEGAMHGHDSWLAQGGRLMETDLSDIVIYTSLAVGLGYLMCELEIPWLSEYIRSDMGNIEISAPGYAGAKIGILLIELLEAQKEPMNPLRSEEALRAKLYQMLKFFYCKDTKIAVDAKLTQEQASALQCVYDCLLSSQSLENLEQGLSQKTLVNYLEEQKSVAIQQLRQTNLLIMLERYHSFLPYLTHRTKRELLLLIKHAIPVSSEFRDALCEQLYPTKMKSIFATTIIVVLGYIPALLRCAMTIVTWNRQPWINLAKKVTKDVTRIFNALSHFLHTFCSFLRVMARNLGDIVGNEIVARVEGMVRDNVHRFSANTYTLSTDLDKSYEVGRQFLSIPVDILRRHVIVADPQHATQHALYGLRCGMFEDRYNRKVFEAERKPVGSVLSNRIAEMNGVG